MGKYMKKGKFAGDVAVMEVPQTALGVRTRARTLALQQNPDFCYLQLRSRRLEKPQFPPSSPAKQDKQKLSSQVQSRRAGSNLRTTSFSRSKMENGAFFDERGSRSTTPLQAGKGGGIRTELDELGVEASFGENNSEFDGAARFGNTNSSTHRSTRESTPCSFTRNFDSIGTPGSAARSTCSGAAYRRQSRNCVETSIPSAHEIDDFFASIEKQQQNQFMDKYNFDVVNDLPLSGRYEWVRVDP